MDAAVERLGDLWINRRAEPHNAAERGLNVAAGAAETFVKIKMAECCIEVVAPHQADHAPSEPDAFRISCGAVD
ncbi:MAG TPA: hypothetical protein VF523_07555, partial [Burkholderiales bacterium]